MDWLTSFTVAFGFRDSEPVNFKHLMSMGYQRDWFNEQDQKAKKERDEKKVCS